MAGKIFVNYRRSDTLATAGRLYDRLAQAFGRKSVFMDVDKIPAGVDFAAHLSAQVQQADVVLAIIGPSWLTATDDQDRARITRPNDFVAIEIAAALERNIRVIPVLVDGAAMPREHELPDRLKGLARRNAIEIRNTQFGRDAEALVAKVREALNSKRHAAVRWTAAAAGAIVALLIVWIGLGQAGIPLAAVMDAFRSGDISRLRQGLLRVHISSGLIGQNFWLYVDGRLKLGPVPDAERLPLTQVELTDGSGFEFWDDRGLVVRLKADRPTYVRPGMESQIFKTTHEIPLAPGNHVVEIATEERFPVRSFPFRLVKSRVTIATGATAIAEVWARGFIDNLALPAPDSVLTDAEQLKRYQDILTSVVAKFEADPIASRLREATSSVRASPQKQRTITIDLPSEFGGPRELDATQISLTIDALTRIYARTPPHPALLQRMPASLAPQLTFIDTQIKAHNKRIEDLRGLVLALQQVK